MNINELAKKGAVGLLVAALLVLPGSVSGNDRRGASPATAGTLAGTPAGDDWFNWDELEAKVEAALARLQERLTDEWGAYRLKHRAKLERMQAKLADGHYKAAHKLQDRLRVLQDKFDHEPMVWTLSDDGGWLGVSIADVTAEKAKELKLPAERGVLITDVETDSPAAKAGLKANDVVTEMNGQRIEGAAQFRRMVRETPAGRTAQMTVWRDGKSQTLGVTVGNYETPLKRRLSIVGPRDFDIQVPDFKIDIPNFKFSVPVLAGPTLGVYVEDLSGQLGAYFGAPDGEGVLVKEVRAGSPAEKAGLKAGDVIVKVDGKRVRTAGDLRDELRERREQKTVAVAVVRRGTETTVNVEIEQPKRPDRRQITRRVTL